MKPSRSLTPGLFAIGLVVAISFLFSDGVSAQPLNIAIYNAQYTTYVMAGGPGMTPVSRTTSSPSPVNDEVDLVLGDPSDPDSVNSHALASAGLFAVSEQTYHTTADAEAVSQIWFSPLADQTQTLNIQISAGLPFDEGQIGLFDLTANFQVWNYFWYAMGPTDVPLPVPPGNNIPWDNYLASADFNVDTGLLSSHQYELTMAAASDARDDSEIVNIQLSGLQANDLQATPEPAGVFLLALSVAAATFCRRRK